MDFFDKPTAFLRAHNVRPPRTQERIDLKRALREQEEMHRVSPTLGPRAAGSAPTPSSASPSSFLALLLLRRELLPFLCVVLLLILASVATMRVPRLTYADVPPWLVELIDPAHAEYEQMLYSADSKRGKLASSAAEDPLDIRFFRRDNSLHREPVSSSSSSQPKSKSSFRRRSLFRIAVFTDMHYGEDGHLDALTMQLQTQILRRHKQHRELQAAEQKLVDEGAVAATVVERDEEIDLAVLLGDMTSQENYGPLRPPLQASGKQQESAGGEDERTGIPSCLRDAQLGARKCQRQVQEPFIRYGVPVAQIFGNHCPPPTALWQRPGNGTEGRFASLAELSEDTRLHFESSAADKSSDGKHRQRGRALVCHPRRDGDVDTMCTLIVPRAVDRDDEVPRYDEGEDGDGDGGAAAAAMKQRLLEEPQLVLSFFQSIADDTDTLLLHGYKYASQRQLGQFRGVSRRLDWLRKQRQRQQQVEMQRQSATAATPLSAPPLHFAFVHVPPPIFLSHSARTLLATGGTANETPACSPKTLAGPLDFSRLLLDAGVNVVVCGHDHNNDEWAVHDRARLRELVAAQRLKIAGSASATDAAATTTSDSSAVSSPIHLVYGRHSAFGGYVSQHLPGVRFIETFELHPRDFTAAMNANLLALVQRSQEQQQQQQDAAAAASFQIKSAAALERARCRQIGAAYPDLKLCHFRYVSRSVTKNGEVDCSATAAAASSSSFDALVARERACGGVYVVVRSWIVEPQALDATPLEMEHDPDWVRRLVAEEEAVKAKEPAQRLLHSKLRGVRIRGLRANPQRLVAVTRSSNNNGAGGSGDGDAPMSAADYDFDRSDCAGEVDYRIHFVLVMIVVWCAPMLALVLMLFRLSMRQDRTRKVAEKFV
jgi:hypothetical protein